MKKQSIIGLSILALTLGTLSSCNKWLDVQPSTQTTEDKQFSSQQGYIDALIGTYQKMADNKSYGKDLGYGVLDVLAQLFQNKANQTTDTYGQLARYNYTDADVETTINSLWNEQYAIIAQTNYILKDIDANKSMFQQNNFNIIKGEALAIRAMIHFDLLRLFAPVKSQLTAEDQSTIPYLNDFTVKPTKALDFDEIIAQIISDLNTAENLLAVNTTIDQIKDNTGITNLEIFNSFRQNRLNYWAVKGILARVYQYNEDSVNALKYAKEVIDSEKFFFVNGNTNTTNPTLELSNATFSTEHIFSVYKSDQKIVSDRYFKTESSAAEGEDYFSTQNNLNTYYEVSVTGHAIDIRGPQASNSRWNVFNTSTIYSNKYHVGANVINVNQKLVPVIKLAEMYYIAAEASPSIDEALFYLNKVRTARLIPALSNTNISNATQLANEIFKEYRKEFMAEGQLWYYYKRKNQLSLQNTVDWSFNLGKYVFPIPNKEIEFGIN
ncbi:RagB/SusD family nutrient uptake outer membrane protein [Sphingobacterium sp. HJSM2_6]|uniref:RagB/SusD family nutrient uptake outer membrane protein n=1 Tax=Sphingobacterium sp. HJSM2_6 TaxID=3366264 RepID=UPI003BD8A6EF